MQDETPESVEPTDQAVRFDEAARQALETLPPGDEERVLALARERLAALGSPHELQALGSRRARAALVDCREAYYADVLAGRRPGSDGTIVRWIRAWADAGLPPLDAVEVLGLPVSHEVDAVGRP